MLLIPALFIVLIVCIVGSSYIGLFEFVGGKHPRVWGHLICTVMVFALGFITDFGSSILGNDHHTFYTWVVAVGMLMTATNYFLHHFMLRSEAGVIRR